MATRKIWERKEGRGAGEKTWLAPATILTTLPLREGSVSQQPPPPGVLDVVLGSESKSFKQISSHKYIDFSQLILTGLQGPVFLYFHIRLDCFLLCHHQAVISEIRDLLPPPQHPERGPGWAQEQVWATPLVPSAAPTPNPRPGSPRQADPVPGDREVGLSPPASPHCPQRLPCTPSPPIRRSRVGPVSSVKPGCLRTACQL